MFDIRTRFAALASNRLMVAGLAVLSGVVLVGTAAPLGEGPPVRGVPAAANASAQSPEPENKSGAAERLTPRMRAALDYASRRYRVSAQALAPIFGTVQAVARELRLDPLLIVAVIAIESAFNPFSESEMGAQGLMQIIPRYHRDKLPAGGARPTLFDPDINVRVGARALHEYIRRSGDLVSGLQQFVGNPDDPEDGYAARVLAEKERLETAGREAARSRLTRNPVSKIEPSVY